MLPILPSDSFDWIRWRECDVLELFGCFCRSSDLYNKKLLIRKYAIGYISAEKLICRPKINHKAVMFLNDDKFSWCHLTNIEFENIFKK